MNNKPLGDFKSPNILVNLKASYAAFFSDSIPPLRIKSLFANPKLLTLSGIGI